MVSVAMKIPPQEERFEELLRHSKISAGGFLGHEHRTVDEIIEADAVELKRLGVTARALGKRMRAISETAMHGLEMTVNVDHNHTARMREARGSIICPWPHPGSYAKRVTSVRRTDSGEEVVWSELNIHMIEAHGFFEGKGAPFRIEPAKLVSVIF